MEPFLRKGINKWIIIIHKDNDVLSLCFHSTYHDVFGSKERVQSVSDEVIAVNNANAPMNLQQRAATLAEVAKKHQKEGMAAGSCRTEYSRITNCSLWYSDRYT